MVKVLIVGAAGMIGGKLADRLIKDGVVSGKPIEALMLADIVAPPTRQAAGIDIASEAVDLAEPGVADRLIAGRPEVIFQLAAITSAEAESDLDKGYRVNLDGMRLLFDAVRRVGQPYCPRLVWTSSIAVFGAPFPDAIHDDFFHTPFTSYGTAKAIGELLLSDYTRRGFFDGIGIRLPTIVVRPTPTRRMISGFFSSIIREPLAGREAILPVPESIRHWHATPRSAVNFLIHAAGLDSAAVGARRTLTMPGVSVTVAGQIAALRNVAGDRVAARVVSKPDQTIMRVVEGWPRNFAPERALSLGFRAEADFEEIIRVHIEDELGGTWVT
jgi:nucleoside-diphosphate-sugar epimerase